MLRQRSEPIQLGRIFDGNLAAFARHETNLEPQVHLRSRSDVWSSSNSHHDRLMRSHVRQHAPGTRFDPNLPRFLEKLINLT
ncbi:MAG: hypothetical protein ACI8Y4_004732 [Candidatus Poriferisodalaceae bacterium]|jgi:hypothetical protein